MPIPIPILQGLKLLDQLPLPRLDELSRALSERRVQRREVVVKLGDAGGLGLLIEGRLQTVSYTLDGREVGTDFVDAGDFFGELSVIDGKPAPEYVIAVAPSRVVMLERERARELMFSTPAGAAAVATRLAERLRRSATHKAVLALPSSFQRVCAQLDALARPAGGDGGLRVRLVPTHQEIAIMVNTSRETVTRTLQYLLGLEVVAREGHDLVVLNPELLRQAVDGSFGPTR